MITIEYHADLKEVQGDPRLNALLSAEIQNSPFDRLSWWQQLERHCGLQPMLAVARDGEALAVLPLQAERGHLRALANWYSFAVRPLSSTPQAATALFSALAADLRRRAWRITLSPMPDERGEASLLEQAFAAAGWRIRREACDVNHVLEVAGRSFAEWFAARPGQLRSTIKRKRGKVAVEIRTAFAEAEWREYEDVYQDSWKPEEGSPEFLRDFARTEADFGRLRLGLARHEGRVIAAQFWTVDHGIAYIHKLAHRDEARPLSAGSVLSAALFEHAIDVDRVALIDFGTGDDGYKRDWMEAVRPRFRLDMFDPAQPRAWPHLARAALQQLAPAARHR